MTPIPRSMAVVMTAALLAACAGGPAPRSSTDPSDADATITSVDIAFDQATILVPASEQSSLALVNEDAVPHNVAIYTDSTAAEDLFVGDYVTDGTIVYDLPALEPGEYFFRCDLHPEMAGTLVVEG